MLYLILTASPNATKKSKWYRDNTLDSSGSAILRTKHGAQFSFDPTTKLVTLVTPSGKTHILRLPMIAIMHMFGLSKPNPSASPFPSVIPSPSPAASPNPSASSSPSPVVSPFPSPSVSPSPSPSTSPTPTPSTSPSPTPQATESANLTTQALFTETTNTAGEPVLTQIVSQPMKFLGIIPVGVSTTITINELTGEVLSTPNSQVVKALGFLFKI